MAELSNGLNHVTAIRQELEVLVIIANRWVTEFLVVQLRRASSGDFKVRFGEICVHAEKPVSLTPRRQGASGIRSLTHLFFAPSRLGVSNPLDCISKETRGPSRTGVERPA